MGIGEAKPSGQNSIFGWIHGASHYFIILLSMIGILSDILLYSAIGCEFQLALLLHYLIVCSSNLNLLAHGLFHLIINLIGSEPAGYCFCAELYFCILSFEHALNLRSL